MNFHFVSVSPSKKNMVDRNLVKHLKHVQEEEIKSWTGLNVKFTMRPGNNNIEGSI